MSKALKKNDEQWEDTCSLLAETACRSFKKYVAQSHNAERGAEIWENLVALLSRLLQLTDGIELCKTIFKAVADLAPICSIVISQDSINQLVKVARDLIEKETERSRENKSAVLKLLKSVSTLVESLKKIYDQTELFDRNTECLY